MDSLAAFERMTFGHRLFLRICEFPKPTIAMVNGYALGGGFELALSCDLMVASENAVFGFPEITLDTLPGWGGTQLAPRKMGPNRAREMVLTGHRYSAADCREFGFINRLVPASNLRDAARELACRSQNAIPSRSAWPRAHCSRLTTLIFRQACAMKRWHIRQTSALRMPRRDSTRSSSSEGSASVNERSRNVRFATDAFAT